MHVFHHPHRRPPSPEALADGAVWILIVGVVIVNALLMWRIATGGF